ncbi:TPA: hypothetical protein ACS55J_000718 [Salmonella enterica]
MSTWVLIIWMYFPYNVLFASSDQQPAMSIQVQEFTSEQACKKAFLSIKEVNNGEINLRGVCTPKG